VITAEPRTIVITGASDGIGAAAAAQLSASGHRVVVVGRSREKTRAAADACRAVASFTADFADLAQVRRLAAELRDACPRIDVLANNAGGVFPRGELTVDGLPLTMQVNHLAPFLLTNELLDVLIDSGASVVNTSSMAARFGHVLPGDLDGTGKRRPSFAYSDAKLSNILFTRGLHRRYAQRGLSTVAIHPGVVATSFGSASGGLVATWYGSGIGRRWMITAEQGGANLAHFVTGTSGIDWVSGQFYDDHWNLTPLPRQARDDSVVDAHWELSARLVGLPA
jgi:NAD(P)-dependent dehydrogenase (short-subunit alcohol dehydrogenase family)